MLTGRKSLRELIEKGELSLGSTIRVKRDSIKEILSKKEDNGYKDQLFSNKEIDFFDWIYVGSEYDHAEFILKMDLTNSKYFDLFLKGARGYVNNSTELNKIAQIAKTHNIQVRSTSTFDINNIANITVDYDGKVHLKSNPYENLNEISEAKAREEHIFNGKEYSPQSFLKNKYERMGKRLLVTNYSYTRRGLSQVPETTKNIIFLDDVFYWLDMQTQYVYNEAVYYCVLAVIDGIANIGGDLFHTNGSEYTGKLAVRPFAKIREDLTLEDIGAI